MRGSLATWRRILAADPDARSGIYQKLAIATALAPPGSGNRGAGMAKTPGDPVDRYKHFKTAHARGELDMIFPTIRNLESIAGFTTTSEVFEWARNLREIPRIEPRIVVRDGEAQILIPGDLGYEL